MPTPPRTQVGPGDPKMSQAFVQDEVTVWWGETGVDIANNNDKLVCSVLEQRGAQGLWKPQEGAPNTAWGQEGRDLP